MAGRCVNGAEASDLAKLGVCSIPEGRGIFANLTVRENLWIATGTGSDLAKLEEIAYNRFPILGKRKNQLAGSMFRREQQMLALSRALGTDPTVLLDELSMGLAPRIVSQMYDIVGQTGRRGPDDPGGRAVRPRRAADRRSRSAHAPRRVVRVGAPTKSRTNFQQLPRRMTMTTLADERRAQFKSDVDDLSSRPASPW